MELVMQLALLVLQMNLWHLLLVPYGGRYLITLEFGQYVHPIH